MFWSEKQILKIIVAGPLVFIPLLIIITVFLTLKTNNDTLLTAIDALEKEMVTLEKQTIKARVDSFAELITYRKSVVKEDLKERLKQRVNNAHDIAETIYQHYHTSKSPQEIKHIITTTLRPSQWNDGESYIWVVDNRGVLQLGPSNIAHLEGQSILDLKDATGKYVIQEEIKICRTLGEGYLEDTFVKPHNGLNRQFKQIAFVKDFGHYGWYFGTAEFLDTAATKRDKELLESISKLSTPRKHSLFVVTTKGEILYSQEAPLSQGKNVFDGTDKATLKTFRETIELLKHQKSTYITYSWENPDTSEIERKYTYVHTITDSDWVIGSGFYESTIKEMMAKQTVAMYDVYYSKFRYLIVMSLLFLAIGLLLSLFLSRYLKRHFSQYQSKILATTTELKQLNNALEEKVQERTQALKTLSKELEVLATTDSLTEINNRYAIMNILENEISRAARYKRPLSVIMFDADYFKEVNDTYGHDVGDQVLHELAQTVKERLRDIDYIGRYGGEEFLIIMPDTTAVEATRSAERIRTVIEKHCFEGIDTMTVSLGLTQWREGEDLNTLFKRLDQLMYKAKERGRNQLVTDEDIV